MPRFSRRQIELGHHPGLSGTRITQTIPDHVGDGVVDGAGVGLLLLDPEFREHLENGVCFYFQLSC